MTRSLIQGILLLSLSAISCWSQTIPPPTEEASPSTEEGAKLIRAGVQLHDLRDYDGAIAKYKQVLQDNPRDAKALYELTYSYFAKKDYRKSIETALEGLKYRSPYLGQFYEQLGSAYDELGQPAKALEVYKEGIKQDPRYHLLPFNAGITYMRMEKMEEAQKSFQAALFLHPVHASSHFRLGDLFLRNGQKVPALLALSRYLILEPDSPRSAAAFQAIRRIMTANVSPSEKGIKITLPVPSASKEGEEDFSTVETGIAVAAAAAHTEKGKRRSEIEQVMRAYQIAFEVLARQKRAKKEAFVSNYYVPYFSELDKSKHTETFTYFIAHSAGIPGVREWLEQNKKQVRAFLEWDRQYPWEQRN